ncbi:MAG: stage II sporulation protein R [Eubacterium sp.]|nr:stage II sporulation protein R [Eubacterium sp.]
MIRQHRLKIAGIVIMVAATGILMYLYGEATKGQRQQRAIAEQIIRLHVIANSDTDEDQELKMKVKETIVTYLRGEMQDATSVDEARQAIREHLPEIEEIAAEKMRAEGYEYTAEATLGESYFPVKEYGDLTFPAGNYEALRVRLGESAGHNWWCVMYPSLCFVDSTYQVVPDASKERLKDSLTREEYDSLLDGGEEVSYSWKAGEWLKNLFG